MSWGYCECPAFREQIAVVTYYKYTLISTDQSTHWSVVTQNYVFSFNDALQIFIYPHWIKLPNSRTETRHAVSAMTASFFWRLIFNFEIMLRSVLSGMRRG